MKRSRLRRVSKKRQKEYTIYLIKRADYLERHPCCKACWSAPATQVHHRQGRNGKRLNDARSWLPICAPCHLHLHDHPAEARKLKLLK